MSDETPRTENGQFTAEQPIPETIVGQREAAAGYTALSDEQFSGLAPSEDAPTTVEAEAAKLTEDRAAGTSEADIRNYSPLDGFLESLDPNVTLTIDQASELTTASKESELKAAEEAAQEKLRQEVDSARGEVADPIDAVDGLDAETRRALKIPQVARAIEDQFVEADKVREQHTATLQAGQQMLQASLASLAPQLQGVPVEHWEQALQQMAQTDPVRAELVADTLDKWGRLQFAQNHYQQEAKQREHQQVETWAKSENARLEKMLGTKVTTEVSDSVVDYAKSMGIERETLGRTMMAHPILRSAEVQRMMVDAARYHALKAAPPRAAPKNIPPVIRPGVSNQVRASDQSAKIATLERQLSSATGDRAARLSAQIHGLQRQARS